MTDKNFLNEIESELAAFETIKSKMKKQTETLSEKLRLLEDHISLAIELRDNLKRELSIDKSIKVPEKTPTRTRAPKKVVKSPEAKDSPTLDIEVPEEESQGSVKSSETSLDYFDNIEF